MADKTTDVYLGLGSNLGNRNELLREALRNIDLRIGRVVALSSFYETAPDGFDSDNFFLNAACHIQTQLSAEEVLEVTQVIERELGRRQKSAGQGYADRPIDIDILLYDGLVVELPHLQIPHPRMHERAFVLLPLADIAPEAIHPISGKTIAELKRELPD